MSKPKGKGNRFWKTFRFRLTTEQRAERATKQAEIVGALEIVEEEKAKATKLFNDRLKTMRAHLAAVARTVRNGAEDRHVECEIRKHPTKPFMELVRLDTGEVSDQRPMSDAERQITLEDKWARFVEDMAKTLETPEPPAEDPTPAADAEPAKGGKKAKGKKGTQAEVDAAAVPTCSAPEPANESGVCGADGDPDRQGFCRWHVEKFDDAERKRLLADRRKREAGGAPAADKPAGKKGDGKKKPDSKTEREQLANAAQTCLDCKEFPCVCEDRAGDNATH